MNETNTTKKHWGRPSNLKYKSTYAQAMIDEFNKAVQNVYEKKVVKRVRTSAGVTETYQEVGCDFPTFEAFARKIGATHKLLVEWAEEHPGFKDAYERCFDIQKEILQVNGLKGTYNPLFMRIAALNIMNWTDGRKEMTSLKKEVKNLSDKDLIQKLNKKKSNIAQFKKVG